MLLIKDFMLGWIEGTVYFFLAGSGQLRWRQHYLGYMVM